MIARIVDGAIAETRELELTDIPNHKQYLWTPVIIQGTGTVKTVDITGEVVSITYSDRPLSSIDVNIERDRRLMTFTFGGTVYDFDTVSRGRIDKARGSAMAAIIGGAQADDLRWADANVDFGWIAADNSFVLMDALTTLAFGNAAASWEGLHIVAARNLKDMTPIPEDYATNDSYWPSPA